MGTFRTRNKSLTDVTIYGKFGESEEDFQRIGRKVQEEATRNSEEGRSTNKGGI